jgi:hypothetical protein
METDRDGTMCPQDEGWTLKQLTVTGSGEQVTGQTSHHSPLKPDPNTAFQDWDSACLEGYLWSL